MPFSNHPLPTNQKRIETLGVWISRWFQTCDALKMVKRGRDLNPWKDSADLPCKRLRFWNSLNPYSENMWFWGLRCAPSTHGPSGTSHQSSLPFAAPGVLDELQPGHIQYWERALARPHAESTSSSLVGGNDFENPQLVTTWKNLGDESVELPKGPPWNAAFPQFVYNHLETTSFPRS